MFLIYIKAEFDLPTNDLSAGITNNISKILITLGNIFPICFTLMTEMAWGQRPWFFIFIRLILFP